MKLLVVAVIFLSLYLIYRLSFSGQQGNSPGNKTPSPKPPEEDEGVVKSRFVLPAQSNSTQHEDRKQASDIQEESAPTFAIGNGKRNAVIPPEKLPEIFGEAVHLDELDIEPDANETDSDNEPNADEEAEEIRQSAGEIEGYAEGVTYDELTTVIHEAGNPEAMTKAAVATLRDLAQTDMFEQLVSGDAGRSARIAAVLDHSEQNLAGQAGDTAESKGSDYKEFDITQFLS
jgi:hypothetical protein